jgi:hypothetical protein
MDEKYSTHGKKDIQMKLLLKELDGRTSHGWEADFEMDLVSYK